MRKGGFWGALFLAAAACVAFGGGVNAPGVDPNQYIVVLKAGADPHAVVRRHGVAPNHVYKHALKGFAGLIPPGQLAELVADPEVEYIEQDGLAHTCDGTVPPGVQRIGANPCPVSVPVDADIAIIDTGVDWTHTDLNVVYHQSWIAGDSDTSGTDLNGHGTHVAGIAAANGGIVGVAPGARLWSLKVLDATGNGYFSDVIAAINFVAQQPPDGNGHKIEVVNMSLGATGSLQSLRTAIQNCVAAGVVVVVAAGNNAQDVYGRDGKLGTKDDFIPAAYPEVAAISAMADTDGQAGGLGAGTGYGADDTLASFSNYSRSVVTGNPVTSPGAAIDVAAPGVNILSTWPGGGYQTLSGTSMASPHVAGAAALYVAGHGRAANAAGVAAIRQAIINAAQPQSTWRSGSTNDRDSNHEGLVYVANFAPPAVGSIAGTVTNASTGSAISGATVSTDSGQSASTGTDGTYAIANVPVGTRSVTAAAAGFQSQTQSNVTVTANTTSTVYFTLSSPTTVSVTSITYATSGNHNKNLNITVQLKDNLGNAVSGAKATITVSLNGASYTGFTGTTGANGTVTFTISNAPSGTYSATVTVVLATGLTWDGATPPNSFKK